MVKKIALEEHFLCPGFEDYWRPTVGDVDPDDPQPGARAPHRFRRDAAFGHGPAPGSRARCCRWRDPACRPSATPRPRVRKAREANDFLAREIAKRPDRYSGFAHLPMQDARAAADELERCMRELKFCGAMINGHTNGQYLDHPSLYPFWERARGAGRADLHPSRRSGDALARARGHEALRRATWEWGFETGSHALRLVFGGHFDRFPRAQHRARPSRRNPAVSCSGASTAAPSSMASSSPSRRREYIKENIVVTTLGHVLGRAA